jgi:molybdopterin converting factor small subunit
MSITKWVELTEELLVDQHEQHLKKREEDWENKHKDYKEENNKKFQKLKEKLNEESENLVASFESNFSSLQGKG